MRIAGLILGGMAVGVGCVVVRSELSRRRDPEAVFAYEAWRYFNSEAGRHAAHLVSHYE